AEVAALILAERDHEAATEHRETRAKRPDVDELAAGHHEGAERHERDRHDVLRVPDQPVEPLAEPAADVPAVPAEVEDGAEEEAERNRRETPQLGALALRAGASLRPRLADAARELRAQLRLPLAARHGLGFRARPGLSSVDDARDVVRAER